MLQLVTNLWINLAYFLFLLLLFHIIILVGGNLSKLEWKTVDYVYLTFAAISALAITIDNGITYSQMILPLEQSVTFTRYISVRELAISNKRILCDTQFVKSQISPKNFDDILRQDKELCNWFSLALDTILKEDQPDKVLLSTINYGSLPKLNNISHRVLLLYQNSFLIQVDGYNKAFDKYTRLKEQSDSKNNYVYKFFAPFFLPIALALRITKVTGELMLEQVSSKVTKEKSNGEIIATKSSQKVEE